MDINHGPGVPDGTFHFALRCDSLKDLEQRRLALISTGVVVVELIDLNPYRSFFFDDPVHRLRLEDMVQLRQPKAADSDPLRASSQPTWDCSARRPFQPLAVATNPAEPRPRA